MELSPVGGMLQWTSDLSVNESRLKRWGEARAVGSVCVAGIALKGAGQAGLRCCQSLRQRDSQLIAHVREVVRHLAAAVTALVLGILAPSELMLPAMRKLGFEVAESHRFTRRALLGAGLLSAGVAVYALGIPVFDLMRRAKTLTPAAQFAWPSVKQIAATYVGANILGALIARKCQGVGPFTGTPVGSGYFAVAEVPIIGTFTSITALIRAGLDSLVLLKQRHSLDEATRKTAEQTLQAIKNWLPSAVRRLVPFVAIWEQWPSRFLKPFSDGELINAFSFKGGKRWCQAVMAENVRRATSINQTYFNGWTVKCSGIDSSDVLFLENQGIQWILREQAATNPAFPYYLIGPANETTPPRFVKDGDYLLAAGFKQIYLSKNGLTALGEHLATLPDGQAVSETLLEAAKSTPDCTEHAIKWNPCYGSADTTS